MKQIPEQCKKAIANNLCLGCTGLAEEDWTPPKRCPYLPTAQESINKIYKNLGVDKNGANSRNDKYKDN